MIGVFITSNIDKTLSQTPAFIKGVIGLTIKFLDDFSDKVLCALHIL
jgi:hypothetical protein